MIRTLFIALGLLALAACNTVQGVGQDVKSGGEAISNTASDVQKKL